MESEGIELASAIAATRLLILTGCRLSEIMTLQWEHVDVAGKALRLPDSKTGAKVVHLGQPAVEVLRKIERVEKNPWVVVGTKPNARLTDLQPFWQRVRARAGLKDVRIHDLRHTFASTAVASGQGLPDDRQAPRPHAGADHRPLRTPRRRPDKAGGRICCSVVALGAWIEVV
jgi:integrase